MPTRRQFLGATAAAGFAAPGRPWVGVQVYPFTTFRRREKRPEFDADLPTGLGEVARTGADGFEGTAATPAKMTALGTACKAAGLAVRSVYVPATLHDPMLARAAVRTAVATAAAGKPFGVQVVVCNPEPLSWIAPQDKTDQQLRTQAQNLAALGKALAAQGQVLAYHTHDAEMRHAAREFHHMLLHTDPAHVGLCLDAHWIFRGAGDSELAVQDVVRLYGRRVVEVHLRQSRQGVWTEAFGPGDLDYARLGVELAAQGAKPLLVLEQAVEAKTPATLDAVTAHTRGLEAAREVFGAVPA